MDVRLRFLLFFLYMPLVLYASQGRRVMEVARISSPPRIDGDLNDAVWKELPSFDRFIQWGPYNGSAPSQPTKAWVAYDDEAIYIGAVCYDSSPDSIMADVSPRDVRENINTEMFGVHISPYDDGINSLFFDVTPAGVQRDIKFCGDGAEGTWDAVWESGAEVNGVGWTVEMKIPYSALRFPNAPVQDWGFNLWRWLGRKREWSTWSHVSNEIDCWWKESGLLRGLRELDPPVRLSFTPYVSGYMEHSDPHVWGYSYNGGMDLKYGVTESFTLDMTLIPDFGQVLSDDEQLNLSPYEIQYSERRPFFMEGTELFNKGSIFYSRRVGGQPSEYDSVEAGLGEHETILENPSETRMINASKFSGRTNGGLGIGVFNAMTSRTAATVRDTLTGAEREEITQPFTNYNLIVLDQTLFANSYVSLINSNVARRAYTANVTAAEFKLADAKNAYRLHGSGAYSRIDEGSDVHAGFKYNLDAGKVGGTFQYSYDLSVISDTYDQNDLGYMQRNNEVEHEVRVSHHMFKPFGVFRNMTNQLYVQYNRMYRPDAFSDFNIQYVISATLKNQYSFQMHAAMFPVDRRDYYEPRVNGRYILNYKAYHNCFTIETDTRRALSAYIHGGFTNSYDYDFKVRTWNASCGPRWRINPRFNVGFDFFMSQVLNAPGYVDSDDGDIITFGRRDRQTVENTLTASYMFSNHAFLNLRLRHYWSQAEYDGYFTLQHDGRLEPSEYDGNHDVNYNAFNIDMTFRWIFAPGSEMVVNWKNTIVEDGDHIIAGFWENMRRTWRSPQVNSFSVKILYYLDSLSLFR